MFNVMIPLTSRHLTAQCKHNWGQGSVRPGRLGRVVPRTVSQSPSFHAILLRSHTKVSFLLTKLNQTFFLKYLITKRGCVAKSSGN